MPFKSSAQRGYLFANDPKVAKEFAKETPRGKKLPKHVKRKKQTRASSGKPVPRDAFAMTIRDRYL